LKASDAWALMVDAALRAHDRRWDFRCRQLAVSGGHCGRRRPWTDSMWRQGGALSGPRCGFPDARLRAEQALTWVTRRASSDQATLGLPAGRALLSGCTCFSVRNSGTRSSGTVAGRAKVTALMS
jgi:hypothetical protein